jgi:hypothetical protein
MLLLLPLASVALLCCVSEEAHSLAPAFHDFFNKKKENSEYLLVDNNIESTIPLTRNHKYAHRNISTHIVCVDNVCVLVPLVLLLAHSPTTRGGIRKCIAENFLRFDKPQN